MLGKFSDVKFRWLRGIQWWKVQVVRSLALIDDNNIFKIK